MPSDRTAGFLVRLYRTFESSSHYDVRMVHDPNLRQARLMLSEQLNRQHADAAVAPAVIAAAVRALHVAHPLPHLPNDLTMTLAVLDPLTKMPLKLFPALDEDGEVTMLPQHACCDDPLPTGFSIAYPMAHDALKLMASAPDDANPRLDHLQSEARSIVGLGGFIACNLRPDAFFAYVAITQRIAHHFTKQVWHATLRWAHYLVNTRELRLTYRYTDEPRWCMHSDSSLVNTDGGGSYGGFAFGLEGNSGYVDWRCIVPRMLSDSSAGVELIMATLATKSMLGYRMLLKELRVLPEGPMPLYLDAKAVIQGADMEKVTREMRFMAVRYAMLRQVVDDKKIELKKVDTEWNRGGIFTKPLVGEAFLRGRAMALGLSVERAERV